MNIKRKIIKKIVTLNPKRFSFLPDELYIQLKFYDAFGRFMNFSNPKTFNEKLQWLKIHDRKPEYTKMVDKYKCKSYVGNIIGYKYIVPTIGVWDHFDEIDFEMLPNQFVLKCTHDSGGLVVCNDKNKLDINATRKKIETSLSNNFYYMGREWPYKDVPHRIIAEQFLADDYRDCMLFSSNNIPRMTLIYSEYFTNNGLKENFYDEVWKTINGNIAMCYKHILEDYRPKQYEIMKMLSKKIFKKAPYNRIDFYEIYENEYLAELTFNSFYDMNDLEFVLRDLKLGEYVRLTLNAYKLNVDECSIIVSNSFSNTKTEKFINDYKIFCFDGEIDSIMVCKGREKGRPSFYYYDTNWNRLYYQHDFLEKNDSIEKPRNLDEMIRVAKILSEGHSFIRVDLFDVDDNIYFGELTFFDDCGFNVDITYETDLNWGKKIKLKSYC